MSSMAEDDKRLSFLPLEKATNPPAGFLNHVKDHWWAVHPTKGLVFFKKTSPQCNSNESLSKRINAMYPWAEVRLIPSVFFPVDPNDYAS